MPLLEHALRHEAVLQMLTNLTNMISKGTAPGVEMLTASRLIALAKPDGGVRPIAVGELIYRLCTKAILRSAFSTDMLAPFQMGVQSAGGVEPIVHGLSALTGSPDLQYRHIASLDFRNAFNAVSRHKVADGVLKHAPRLWRAAKWAYNHPARLVMQDGTQIMSSEGVRQGDPLGPLLFSLAVRATLESFQRDLTRLHSEGRRARQPPIVMAYLDDVYVVSTDPIPLDTIQALLQDAPVTLNPAKCRMCDLRSQDTEGLPVLGSFVGSVTDRRHFLQGKIALFREALQAILLLPRQSTQILLRYSTASILRHLPRTLEPTGLEGEWQDIDTALLSTVRLLAAMGPEEILDPALVDLPTRVGGLGIRLYRDKVEPSLMASRALVATLLATVLPVSVAPHVIRFLDRDPSHPDSSLSPDGDDEEGPEAEPTAFQNIRVRPTRTPETGRTVYQETLRKTYADKLTRLRRSLLTQRDRLLQENGSYLGRLWLTTAPGKNRFQLTDAELATALRIRLFLPTSETHTVPGDPCTHCGFEFFYGHEDVCDGRLHERTARHNRIRDVLAKAWRPVSRSVSVEPGVPGHRNRRADILIVGHNRHAFVDVSIVTAHPAPVCYASNVYTNLNARENSKIHKYATLGSSIEPVILSPGGLMGQRTSQWFRTFQRAVGPAASRFVSTQLSFILLRTRVHAWAFPLSVS